MENIRYDVFKADKIKTEHVITSKQESFLFTATNKFFSIYMR